MGGEEMADDVRPVEHFDLYRYQLLPITQHIQLDLLRGVESIESLKQKKNVFFSEILVGLQRLRHRNIEIAHRLDMHQGDWFVFHIGARKSLERSRKDFKKERLEDWPHVVIIINNSPTVQAIAISRNQKAFTSTRVVAQMLVDNLQPHLRSYQLHLEIEPLFEAQTFWALVNEYQGRIVAVTFELVSPNMATISKSLKLDLAQINADTNSHRTDLKLNSGEGSTLEIAPNNKVIDSLVDYASAGGGDIVLRIKGLNKRIRTSKNSKEVAIDELLLKNPTPESLEFLKKLFD
jgi:hypothetical protein